MSLTKNFHVDGNRRLTSRSTIANCTKPKIEDRWALSEKAYAKSRRSRRWCSPLAATYCCFPTWSVSLVAKLLWIKGINTIFGSPFGGSTKKSRSLSNRALWLPDRWPWTIWLVYSCTPSKRGVEGVRLTANLFPRLAWNIWQAIWGDAHDFAVCIVPFLNFFMLRATQFENGEVNVECPSEKRTRIGTQGMEVEVVDDFWCRPYQSKGYNGLFQISLG